MSATASVRLSDRAWRASGAVVAILGVVALTARPAGAGAAVIPVAVGAAAMAWPAARDRVRAVPWIAATALGGLAFTAVRFAVPGLRISGGLAAMAISVAVAVAEEAFFRRFLYDLLRPAGVSAAVAISAVVFALIHAPLYGAWVVPLDLAAGLLLGWQRHAAGHWSSPAATHALANLLAYWR